MIILDDQNGPLTKPGDDAAATTWNRNAAATVTSTAHPSEQTPQQYYQPARFSAEQAPPPYTMRSSDPSDPLLAYYFHGELNKCARKRFIHALAFAALFWTITGILVRGIFISALKHSEAINEIEYPNETIVRCLDERDWSNTDRPPSRLPPGMSTLTGAFYSMAMIELPEEVDSLFLTSHNFSGSGGVGIISEESDSRNIKVEITSLSLSKDLRDRSKICILSRGNSTQGIGLLGLSEFDFNPSLDAGYGIFVHFPYKSTLCPRLFGSFESNIPRIFHVASETIGKVEFEKVDIRTEKGGIILNSLSADSIHLETTEALITGNLRATKSLYMRTTSSYVETAIQLHSYSNDTATSLLIDTEDSSVDVNAYVRLSAGADGHSEGGNFNVSAMCPGSHLGLRFLDAPLFSTLKVGALSQTAMIDLPPTFEGQWHISSPVRVVTGNPISEDPMGLGRLRQFHEFSHEDTADGASWWGTIIPPAAAKSYVHIETNETAYIHFI